MNRFLSVASKLIIYISSNELIIGLNTRQAFGASIFRPKQEVPIIHFNIYELWAPEETISQGISKYVDYRYCLFFFSMKFHQCN